MSEARKRYHVMLTECLGDLNTFLADPLTTEICVNADGKIWWERLGASARQMVGMSSETIEQILRLVASINNVTVTYANPSIAAVLPGGQRFQGFLPPMSDAPCFTIRCPQIRVLTKEDYVPVTCSSIIWEFLHERVANRKNILVTGGMSSGKTTMMNSLIALIDPATRIVTIEDTKELLVTLPNHVRLYTNNHRTMEYAVHQALRTRAKRIIPGEIRDGATAIAVLTAWRTGHPGGLCTLHADSAQDALYHLEDLCAEVSPGQYQPLIGRSVDCVIFLERFEDKPLIRDVLTIDRWEKNHYVTHTILDRGSTTPPHLQ